MKWAFWKRTEAQEPAAQPRRGAVAGGAMAVAVAGILAAVYADEGGYVNHPADPGGATNYGVTERVARQAGYRGHMRDFPMRCTESKPVCADLIYTRDYIERPGFMPLIPIEPAVADELVNTTVNMGAPRPSRWFQQSLNELSRAGLVVDGKVGPQTIAAYRVMQERFGKIRACTLMLDRLDDKQLAEYHRLVRVNPKLRVFLRGWINHRIGNVDRSRCGKGWA